MIPKIVTALWLARPAHIKTPITHFLAIVWDGSGMVSVPTYMELGCAGTVVTPFTVRQDILLSTLSAHYNAKLYIKNSDEQSLADDDNECIGCGS